MFKFSYHSAQVKCEELPSGASLISFYGTITHKGFDLLQEQACAHTGAAPSIVMRVDTALLLEDEGEDFLTCSDCHHEAVALVVPHSRYEQAMRLARNAAKLGVRRPVFLPEQAGLAHQWAAYVAQSQSARLLPAQL